MKALRIVCAHENRKDENKPFWKEVGSLLVSDGVYDYVKENGDKISIVWNAQPGTYYTAFAPREQDEKKPNW